MKFENKVAIINGSKRGIGRATAELFTKEGAKDFFSYVYPSLKRVISIDKLSQESVQNYIPQDLTVKVFLDYDKQQNMIGEIKFCYGNQEINPFKMCIRDRFLLIYLVEYQVILRKFGIVLNLFISFYA